MSDACTSRYVRPSGISPIASLHVLGGLFTASLAWWAGSSAAALATGGFDSAEPGGVPLATHATLVVCSWLGFQGVARIARSVGPRISLSVVSAFFVIPLATLVGALSAMTLESSSPGSNAVLGIVVSIPASFLVATSLLPLFWICFRAERSRALAARDLAATVAGAYACLGSLLAARECRWWLVPAAGSLFVALHPIAVYVLRRRFLTRVRNGSVPDFALVPIDQAERGTDLDSIPRLHDRAFDRVLVETGESNTYRQSAAPRALLGV